MIILPNSYYLIHFSLKCWENVLFELGGETVKASLHVRLIMRFFVVAILPTNAPFLAHFIAKHRVDWKEN